MQYKHNPYELSYVQKSNYTHTTSLDGWDASKIIWKRRNLFFNLKKCTKNTQDEVIKGKYMDVADGVKERHF